GTQANIRTEVTLRYANSFLGRKKPGTDPQLSGRADYICEAVSYGRWAVEVKSPQEPLRQDDIEQAHTYCAHPEISATHFLLTNGREFRVYAVGYLNSPILKWSFEETESCLLQLYNLLGYDAVKKRAAISIPDTGKPLGIGLPSRTKIVGGFLTYREHVSDHPLFGNNAADGMNATFTGDEVFRTNAGLITAKVDILSAYTAFTELNSLAGLNGYTFSTSEEFVSTDIERPSVFQNVATAKIPSGVPVKIPPLPKINMPFGVDMVAFTQAIGYVKDDIFIGMFEIDYDLSVISNGSSGIPHLDALLRTTPRKAKMKGYGDFEMRLKI
ncbi:MAG: type I restriction endonuclease subunit R, partial [Hyphomonadaceae bacterium]